MRKAEMLDLDTYFKYAAKAKMAKEVVENILGRNIEAEEIGS